ncbi:MAG: hypothetical protein WEE50_06455 [Chloroflexota bacterium]
MTTATTRTAPMVHPTDDVLAVIDDAARADAAIDALRASGFTDADIHVFRGREEIGALARAWWRHSGVPAFLAPILAAVLSDERDVEEIYESEGLAGHAVLAVHTRSADGVERATRVLRDSGAHDTWYFGRWTMAPLDPAGRHAK